ncbi:Uma2 family endonuclease [Argonema antarcticum]|uniref:Uma2 family endonuclease n=1 Tax=Argonema antarcticum TaxID=2942763 RepID=UPI002010E3B5|nr:Uma2 family endonuclease [Argonema antarcticum]MCL1469761.1 Uma2 family endonuclease [Argonema antarcticum A004/B2]
MVQYEPLQYLPSSEELPSSDETPVDNELQDLVPHLLKAILSIIWQERTDWFFGVDMGIYHERNVNPPAPIIPDGFLSLGVERFRTRAKGRTGRLSYVLWEENGILPVLVLEVISQTYGEEYGQKKIDYAELRILYYVIYDADRYQTRRGEPLEVYRLVDGVYIQQPGEPVWIPEIGLAIGREMGTYLGWTREWLFWYDEEGRKYLSPDEARQHAEERAERLAAQLRALGIEPEEV